MGIGIATLVNILNPQLVIVGGEGVHAGEWRFGSMRKAIGDHSFYGLGRGLQIVIEPSGDRTWARGAASLVLREIYRSPIDAGASELTLSTLIDDGAIFYLNGTEVHRRNVPEGPIDHDTLALSAVDRPTLSGPIAIPSEIGMMTFFCTEDSD